MMHANHITFFDPPPVVARSSIKHVLIFVRRVRCTICIVQTLVTEVNGVKLQAEDQAILADGYRLARI